jgi:hypothetical protein
MTQEINIDRAVMIFAGSVNLIGLLLAVSFSWWWLLLCAFVDINLIQANFTGFCPPAFLFKKLGLKPGAAFFNP